MLLRSKWTDSQSLSTFVMHLIDDPHAEGDILDLISRVVLA
jgi:hypothetical protein